MLQDVNIDKVLFLDIETVRSVDKLKDLPEPFSNLWCSKMEKSHQGDGEPDYEQLWIDEAAFHAEFSKIVCISFGAFKAKEEKKDEFNLRVKSFYGAKEKTVLREFGGMLAELRGYKFCAHYGMGFDYPFLAKRYLINRFSIPLAFDSYGKKPWELTHLLDTNDLWKGVQWKGGTSLDLICALYGIASPKDEMNGSEVAPAFFRGDIKDIVRYCEKDVVALARVFQCLKMVQVVSDDDVISATKFEEEKPTKKVKEEG